MAKLEKREIVILAIAALLVLYALYVYVIADRQKAKKDATGGGNAKMETIMSGFTDELNKNKLSPFDHFVIERAQMGWMKNPFLNRDVYRKWLAKDSGGIGATALKIIYSGFVDTGENRLAVLNGIEYRIGEELKEQGYILKNIAPSKVIIFDKKAGNNLEIPLQE